MLKRGPSNKRITEADALEIAYHTDVEDSLQRMKQAGFVVFEGLLDTDEVKELLALMDASGDDDESYYKDGNYLKKEGDPDNRRFDKHFGPPFCLEDAYLKYVDREPAIDVVEGIHGYGTRLIGGSVWITGAGRYPMGLHVDYLPFALPEDVACDPRVEIPVMISTMHIYLNDMYMDLGPTLVVEGSHRSGRVPDTDTGWNGNERKALMCKAGDAILFRSDIWHGALPNVSDERRYMLQVHYGCAYVERPYISPWKNRAFPEEYVERCTDRQRRLLGEGQEGYPRPQGSYVLRQALEQQGEGQWHQE
jgi:hypothetical protein